MAKETRVCPWCGSVAELSEQKMLTAVSMKKAYVCASCKRRHLVIWHEKLIRMEKDIERLERIEEMSNAGEKLADIAIEMGMSPSRVNQILGGL